MSPTPQRAIHLLHVDDDPAITDIVKTFLEREDRRFDVETATSAEEALNRLVDTDFDCVVSDYEMPGQDGIEFLETVREDDAALPVLLYTGKGSEEIASEAISAGVTDYLQKQSGTEHYKILANRSTNAVEGFRSRQALEQQNQRFETVLSNLPVIVFALDPDGVFTLFEGQGVSTIGLETGQIVGESVFDVYSSHDTIISDVERALDGERVERVRNIDEYSFDTTYQPVFDTEGNVSSVIGVSIDITERREQRHDLRIVKQAIDKADVSITLADPAQEDYPLVYVNEVFEELTGYSPDQTLGRNCRFLQGEETDPVKVATLREAIEEEEPVTVELRNYREDGTEFWNRVSLSPIYDDDGQLLRYLGIQKEITDQRQRQQECDGGRQHEERDRTLKRYEQLVEYSPDLLAVLNEDMVVEYQSPPSPLFEWEPKEITGENPLDDIHPDDHETLIEHFSELLDNPEQIVKTEFRAKDSDGEWQWIESRGQNLIDDDDIGGIFTAMRRITDRKQQEQQLTRYSETLEQLQRTTRTLLEATDREEAARHTVEALGSVFDFHLAGLWLSTPDRDALEPVALSERGKDLISEPPTYSAETESLSWEAYNEQELRYIPDMSAHKDRLNPDTPVRSEVIVPLGQYGLLNIGSTEPDSFTDDDIDLIELWADTLSVVFARITQLELLREREEALRRERDRLDEFSSIISHDLRNPLNVAMTRTELAAESCDNDHLTHVADALSRMEALVDDILFLARQGETIGEREQIVFEDVISDCWRTIESGEATITTDGQATLDVDRSRFTQALENLLRNAIDHGGESVTVTVGVMDDEAGFYVADTGPGIPEEDREDVFDSGFTTRRAGTGFGLAIVERICAAHGWSITVTESDAGGARFEVTGVDSLDSVDS